MKKKKAKIGRPKIGEPISITLTAEQKAWVDDQIEEGGTRTQVVRGIIDREMRASWKRAG